MDARCVDGDSRREIVRIGNRLGRPADSAHGADLEAADGLLARHADECFVAERRGVHCTTVRAADALDTGSVFGIRAAPAS